MHEKVVNISLKTEFITLGQLLKLSNIINSGGEVKQYLQTNIVLVNGEKENRRGKKLYKNDEIKTNNVVIKLN